MKKKVFLNEKMKWDGSFLPTFKIKDTKEKAGKLFWRVSPLREGRKEGNWCLVKKVTQPELACVIDELKPVFGLEKVGTHWCIHQKEKYLLMHFSGNDNYFPMNEDDWNKDEEKQLSRIILFRYVFNLPLPRYDNLVQRGDKIISIQETRHSSSKFYFTLSSYEKYFHQSNPSQVLREMLNIQQEKEMILILCRLTKEIDAVTRRVSPRHTYLSKLFYERAEKRCRRNFSF